jgi:hypothetical protein
MLQNSVIRPSSSVFSTPVLLVKKSNGSWQFCIDYRALNSHTVKDKYQIPMVDELIDELCVVAFFTKLDLHSSYYQVWMHDADVEKTTFCTHDGLFEFLVMSFGLTNTPTMCQALMNDVLRSFLRRFVLVFFDNILIYSTSWLEHLCHINLVLAKLQEHSLFVKHSKCSFGNRSMAHLGHVISADGVAMDAHKIQTVLDWPTPQSKLMVQAFLGLAGYYRCFIRGYGDVAVPLT